MKYLLLSVALLCTLNAAAANLPGVLQGPLRLKMAATDYQLALANAPTLIKEKEFKDQSLAALEAYAKDPLLAGAMNFVAVNASSLIDATAGGSGILVNIMHAPARPSSQVGLVFQIFSADAFSIYATKIKNGDEKVEYDLNTKKANWFSLVAAKELTSLAALPPEAEGAIKDALLKKIQEKVKAGDQAAIDPYQTLAAISAQNKKLISEASLAPLAAAAQAAPSTAQLSDQDLIRNLLAASAILKTGVKTGKINAKPAVDRIEKLAAEIDYLANQAGTYLGSGKPAAAEPAGATAP